MKHLLLIAVLFAACKGNAQQRVAKIYNGITHIAVPDYERKHIGFDSIQILFDDKGKFEANFCYPNAWLYSKDTVYTGDTAYREYILGMPVTDNSMLMFKGNCLIRNVSIYYDKWIVIADSIKITFEKIKK